MINTFRCRMQFDIMFSNGQLISDYIDFGVANGVLRECTNFTGSAAIAIKNSCGIVLFTLNMKTINVHWLKLKNSLALTERRIYK